MENTDDWAGCPYDYKAHVEFVDFFPTDGTGNQLALDYHKSRIKRCHKWLHNKRMRELSTKNKEYGQVIRWIVDRKDEYEDMLIGLGAMSTAPCFICGYAGEGYFVPSKHPCAERHHELYKK